MTRIKIIAVFLVFATVLTLCSCKIHFIEPEERTLPSETQPSETEDDYREYPVTKYELKDGAFKITGEVNKYKYADVDGAEKVASTLNEYFGIDMKIDEEINYENGYGNWFWDNGEQIDIVSAAVSMSSKTGKFSFYYKPENKLILAASQMEAPSEEKLLDKATEFANKFSFVTGDLEFSYSQSANDLFYPMLVEGAEDSEDVQVPGRTFYFTSEENSVKRVDAQDGLSCYVECGDSTISRRDTQYFAVTLFADGTIVSANNYITKAQIVSDGTATMIDESRMNEVLSFFTSTKEDDTMIIEEIYIESYSNYFGYPEITPTIKIKYEFKSNPNDVQWTQMSLEGFYESN